MSKTSNSEQEPGSNSKKNKVSLRIENVVASINLGCELPLEKILDKYKDIEKKKIFLDLLQKFLHLKPQYLFLRVGSWCVQV